MSYKKIKLIQPESVRNPENEYIYLGYGYTSTYDVTGLWIKEANGTIILPISGGTSGSGGTSSWWIKSGTDLYYNNSKVFINSDNTGTATAQALTVNGAIKIGASGPNSVGSIRYQSGDFEGYKNLTDGWVSLTSTGTTGTASSGVTYWIPEPSGDYGIRMDPGSIPNKAYIGDSFSAGANDDTLNIDGGINLTKATNSNEGTIHYDTSTDYFEGYDGTSWKKLNVFDYNGLRAYYDGKVLIGASAEVVETDYHLHVSGKTISDSYVTKYADAGVSPTGGYGAYSGGTLKWGLTGTFEIDTYEIDVVNGLIVGISLISP